MLARVANGHFAQANSVNIRMHRESCLVETAFVRRHVPMQEGGSAADLRRGIARPRRTGSARDSGNEARRPESAHRHGETRCDIERDPWAIDMLQDEQPDLQLEAVARIHTQRLIDEGRDSAAWPASAAYACWLHQQFCRHLPSDMLWVENHDTCLWARRDRSDDNCPQG